MADNHKRKEEKKKHFQDLPFQQQQHHKTAFSSSSLWLILWRRRRPSLWQKAEKESLKKPNLKAYFPSSEFVLLFTKRAFYLDVIWCVTNYLFFFSWFFFLASKTLEYLLDCCSITWSFGYWGCLPKSILCGGQKGPKCFYVRTY